MHTTPLNMYDIVLCKGTTPRVSLASMVVLAPEWRSYVGPCCSPAAVIKLTGSPQDDNGKEANNTQEHGDEAR